MGDAKHTPAPWEVDSSEATKIKAADGTLATATHIHLRGRRTPDEVAANARLIAAAPELLEAGKPFSAHATDRAVGAPEWKDSDTVSIVVTIGELRAIAAAIAKAEGRE